MRVVYIVILGYVFIGCSKTPAVNKISYNSVNQVSCTNKTELNSLEFLEQKYRCNNKK